MNFLEMKTEVALTLGNMQTGDPFYASIGSWVNRAVQQVEIMAIGGNKGNLNLYPQLRTSWMSPITIAGVNYFDLPTNKLAITSISSYDKATAVDRGVDKARPLYKDRIENIDLSQKGTNYGYPRRWAFEAGRVYIHPTPSSTPTEYRTYLLAHGYKKDSTLVSDADSPLVDSIWHESFVQYASYVGAVKLGWDGDEYMKAAQVIIGTATDTAGLEDGNDDSVINLEGMATQESVYGWP